MNEKSRKEIDCVLANVGTFLLNFKLKFLKYPLNKRGSLFNYLVRCVTWNVITPFVRSAGLGSWSVISVHCDDSSSEFINNLTWAFLNEASARSFLSAWSDVGIVIIAGSTNSMAGEQAMWRTGPIISWSSNHCCGISWTCKNRKSSAKATELNAFYGWCSREERGRVHQKVFSFWHVDVVELPVIGYLERRYSIYPRAYKLPWDLGWMPLPFFLLRVFRIYSMRLKFWIAFILSLRPRFLANAITFDIQLKPLI